MSKLTTAQAAARLGVTPQTLYAYVSRGVIDRTLAEDGRSSRFDPADVERLAKRARPRGKKQPGRVAVSMASAVTHIDGHRLLYRGHDSLTLCESATFEQVAMLLWTGELPARHRFASLGATSRALRAITTALPRQAPAIERFCAVCAALACERRDHLERRPEIVARHAGDLLLSLVQALPARRQGRASPRFAARLWPKLSSLPPTGPRVRALDRALILLADHELATSTLAARVAASTRADPYAAVLAGLATASGPLHARAASTVHHWLHEAEATADPGGLAQRLVYGRGSAATPGFGHPVYPNGDPRASALLAALESCASKSRLNRVQGLLGALSDSLGTPPNVDFGLGALAYVSEMPLGATDAIFVLARVAGWVAHALEEYTEPPLRFRARATYEGR